MKHTLLLIVILLLLSLSACDAGRGTAVDVPTVAVPTVAVSTVAPTVDVPPVDEPSAELPTVTAPTVEAPDVSTPGVSTPGVSTPGVSTPGVSTPDDQTPDDRTADSSWADRTVYAPGLRPDQQALLDERPGATVYDMQLSVDEAMRPVRGQQTVRYTNTETAPLDAVYFHLLPNLLDGRIEVSDVRVDGEPVAAVLEGPGDILLRVPLAAPLAPGEAVTLEMAFTTTPPTDIGRNYGIFAYYDNILTLAHFYPMVAVYDAEGWAIETPDIQGDVTYSDTAYYLVEVTAPADQTLVGGGIVVDETADGATQTVTYAAGPMRDFYLVAADAYTVVSDTVDGVRVNSYGPLEHPEGAQLALDVALATLRNHSDWLVEYPYTELDIVATPTSALGVEYPGIIANTARMYDINAQTAGGVPWGVILESTTAHEVGHQWFYGLVGNDQLNEPWLDEALTQYATYRYYLDRYGPAGGDSYFSSLLGRWARVDSEAVPIGLPVGAYEEAEYGAIVYGRGPVFVRALADEMGQDTFDAFLRDYVTTFRLGTATTADFRALAESYCDCDLAPLFAEWVYE
jgi:aminopeptidase N